MLHLLAVAKKLLLRQNPASFSPVERTTAQVISESLGAVNIVELPPLSLLSLSNYQLPPQTLLPLLQGISSSTFLRPRCAFSEFRPGSFFTCPLVPTIHIHLFHLFGYSPANKTYLEFLVSSKDTHSAAGSAVDSA